MGKKILSAVNFLEYTVRRRWGRHVTPKCRDTLQYLLHSLTSQKIRILNSSTMETSKPN